jgi:hypothetical protein
MKTAAHRSESAFVSFVSCLDACLEVVGVRPPLDRAAIVIGLQIPSRDLIPSQINSDHSFYFCMIRYTILP